VMGRVNMYWYWEHLEITLVGLGFHVVIYGIWNNKT
jgi:hypothetical protein